MPSGSYSALVLSGKRRLRSFSTAAPSFPRLSQQHEDLVVILTCGTPAEPLPAHRICGVDAGMDGEARRGDRAASGQLAGRGVRVLFGLAEIRPYLGRAHRPGPGRSRHAQPRAHPVCFLRRRSRPGGSHARPRGQTSVVARSLPREPPGPRLGSHSPGPPVLANGRPKRPSRHRCHRRRPDGRARCRCRWRGQPRSGQMSRR